MFPGLGCSVPVDHEGTASFRRWIQPPDEPARNVVHREPCTGSRGGAPGQPVPAAVPGEGAKHVVSDIGGLPGAAQLRPLDFRADPGQPLSNAERSVSPLSDYFNGEPMRVGVEPQFLFDDEIVEDHVGCVFVKDAPVAKCLEI